MGGGINMTTSAQHDFPADMSVEAFCLLKMELKVQPLRPEKKTKEALNLWDEN